MSEQLTLADVLAFFGRESYQEILTRTVDREEYGTLCLYLYQRQCRENAA